MALLHSLRARSLRHEAGTRKENSLGRHGCVRMLDARTLVSTTVHYCYATPTRPCSSRLTTSQYHS